MLQGDANPSFGHQSASVEVLATHPAAAAELLAQLRRDMERNSIFKGQIISLTAIAYGPSMGGVTFIRRPELARRTPSGFC